METGLSLSRRVSLLLALTRDAVQFLGLGTRSKAALRAENLFLRKHLALYLEREIKPRRATDTTRLSMVSPWSTSSRRPSSVNPRCLINAVIGRVTFWLTPQKSASGKLQTLAELMADYGRITSRSETIHLAANIVPAN